MCAALYLFQTCLSLAPSITSYLKMEFSCPNCQAIPETLGLYIPSDLNHVDMGDMDAGYPRDGDLGMNSNDERRPRHRSHEHHGQHRATIPYGHRTSSPSYASTYSHDPPLSPLPPFATLQDVSVSPVSPVSLGEGRQPNSPSRNASHLYSPSTASDATMFQHHYTPGPPSPGHESPPYTYRGEYIYAPATNQYMHAPVPAQEAPHMNPYTQAVDPRLLSPPTLPHRNRSGSVSSQHSHRSAGSQGSTTYPDYPPRSQLHAGHTPAQTPHLLSPPPREHGGRRRSGSGSSSHSHRSEASRSSGSHSRHSSRSALHSPLPSLSHSSHATPSPSRSSTNLSFIQPAPDQPIILPMGRDGENGWVIVPAKGQEVTVIVSSFSSNAGAMVDVSVRVHLG